MTKTYILVFFLLIIVGFIVYLKFGNNNSNVVQKPKSTIVPTHVPTSIKSGPTPTIASISATPKIYITTSATRSGTFVPTSIKSGPTKTPTIFPTK